MEFWLCFVSLFVAMGPIGLVCKPNDSAAEVCQPAARSESRTI